uniref:Cysteine dioxygenase (CDO1) n=1 Tax=uncultured marine group II/III euryarchaeote KM3_80_G12 TaxID=1456515 RepID=A0A075HQD8_9EURY|nr:Cysteine dioxygenase (CDO1) [uncultured marine group II/III euryarchaeote KM3_80_G12]
MLEDQACNALTSGCASIQELVVWLDEIGRRPGLAELDRRLSALPINVDELRNHIGYAEQGYQRNVIKKNEHYELVAICWKSGQSTPIHDHIGSDCAFLIVDGVSTETLYETNAAGEAVVTGQRIYEQGDVCATAEPDIHRISNEESGELINLHVYTPPLRDFNTYAAAE